MLHIRNSRKGRSNMRQQIGGSKNREMDCYYLYKAEEEQSSNNNLTTAAVAGHTIGGQQLEQLQLEEEQKIMSDMKLSAQILKALNSLEALLIFQTVAKNGIHGIDNTSLGQSALRLITRKQFYMRLAALKQAGLILKASGKYRLTCLGLVVSSSLSIIDKGMKFKWALRVLDAAEAGAKQQGQQQRHHNVEPQIKDIIIDKIVTDETIKKILTIEHGGV
jgi:hypothetical protein